METLSAATKTVSGFGAYAVTVLAGITDTDDITTAAIVQAKILLNLLFISKINPFCIRTMTII